jgi:hypothetical protein
MVGFGIAGAVANAGGYGWAFFGLLVTLVGIGADPAMEEYLEKQRKAAPPA